MRLPLDIQERIYKIAYSEYVIPEIKEISFMKFINYIKSNKNCLIDTKTTYRKVMN